jgi:heme/copper-type cytochrome/quinol oxidase subunit 4
MHHVYTGRALEMILVASCLAQLLAQFLCFLHIKKKWDLLVFFLMLVIAMIFVGGSFWVMDSLNYYDMPGM